MAACDAQRLGIWEAQFEGQIWSFWLCHTNEPLPEEWSHWCADDSGHQVHFFWPPLNEEPDGEWHFLFQRAFKYVQTVLNEKSGEWWVFTL